ncbi:MAG: tetratricopeptide repeat-containing sulfotransferase family protein, partial [Mangrovicoccus sp.]
SNGSFENARIKRLAKTDPAGAILAWAALLSKYPGRKAYGKSIAQLMGQYGAPVMQRLSQLLSQGDLREAAQLAEAILAGCPNLLDMADIAAQIYLTLGQTDKAWQHLAGVMDRPDITAQIMTTAGFCRYRLQDYRGALAYFDQGVKTAEALNIAGRCHEILGQNAAAAGHFRQASLSNPALAEAWFGLSRHTDFTQEPELLHQLRERRAQACEDADKALFEFSIAKALRDQGKHAESFIALNAANGLAHHRIDPAYFTRRRAELTAIIDEFTALDDSDGAHGTGVMASHTTVAPIFIVGMPRSGTSLVEAILGNHSQICPGGELTALSEIIAKLRKTDQLSQPEGQNALAEQYCAATSALQCSPYFTDKMPLNAYYLGYALRAFPRAKAIWMQRDDRAVAFSCYKTHFGNGNLWAYDLGQISQEIKA